MTIGAWPASERGISDSSPLNYLALLSDFDLLRKIYATLIIPPAVYREVVESGGEYPLPQRCRARS
jgi:predicted nucleic acid-binding protein